MPKEGLEPILFGTKASKSAHLKKLSNKHGMLK